ncbi:hypothetical protein SHELI_v1c07730 [Spiroplasma helicoides]|uniref:ABC3 transporter permease C-terminal domain-containing protein n=1 Tax=Spiroplasma helicoides TaxID=216938 RepID=A0A1B3SLC7_9MOLU|nr:FtsX-like permease family protein [Spiroplasma helicoides]AOG60722.1 hypothetical protein SHELI_v1c07730 [Spiroplasma helicoides]
MLLFKNGIKQLLKDWWQFLIYLSLISIAVLFTSAFGIVSTNLVKNNNSLTKNFNGYDYTYKFTSSAYNSNDTQTVSPFFAFSNDYLTSWKWSDSTKTDKVELKNNFPTLTIGGDDSVLLPFEFNSKIDSTTKSSTYDSSVYWVNDVDGDIYKNMRLNFGFGDLEGYTKGNNASKPKYSYLPSAEESILNLTDDQKINDYVAKKRFGRFYRFNEKSSKFQNSLIGQLYKKNNNFKDELSTQQRKTALNIFDYMFYLNISSMTGAIKNFIINNAISKYSLEQLKEADTVKKINLFVNGDETTWSKPSKTEDEFIKNGFNGRIGNLLDPVSEGNSKDEETPSKYFFVDTKSLNRDPKKDSPTRSDKKLWDSNEIGSYGSYLLKNYESSYLYDTSTNTNNYFLNDGTILKSKNLFNSYYNLVSDLTNFDLRYTNEVVMWDTRGKYRYISSYYSYQDIENQTTSTRFNNEDLYTIYEYNNTSTTNSGKNNDLLTKQTFMTTYGYYSSNNLSLGSEYQIVPGVGEDFKLRLDAVGVDALNIYPTIYDEDVLTNQDTDAIFYLNTEMFRTLFNASSSGQSYIENTKFQDVSKVYMKYRGNSGDINSDKSLYQLFAADNILGLKEASQKINDYAQNGWVDTAFDYSKVSRLAPLSFDDTAVFNMRSTFFGQASGMFLTLSLSFCIVLLSVILFITYNITKKFLNAQKSQIGNLKALGVSSSRIIISFIIFLSLPIILMVPIGWGLSIALQKPLLNIFGIYFNIENSVIFDYKFLAIEWIVFAVLAIGLIWMIAYRMVRKNALSLMQPSSSNKPNIFITKLFNKFTPKKFTSRIRASLITLSIRDLFTFAFVITISTIILMFSATVPNSLSSMSKKYFNAINYNNDYTYSNIVSNNPFTKYNWRQSDGDQAKFNDANSLFSSYKKTSDGKYLSLLDANGWESYRDYNNFFETIITQHALGLNGYLLSTGILDKVIDASNKLYENGNKSVETKVKQLTCSVLPQLFNQPAIEDTTGSNAKQIVEGCIKSITNNTIPSVIKQRWEDDNNKFLNFSFAFNTISYDNSKDEIYTNVNAYDDGNHALKIYGLNEKSAVKNINLEHRDDLYKNYNDDESSVDVLINEATRLKGYKVGDKINLNFSTQELNYIDANGNYDTLSNNFDWYYQGKEINLNEVDLGHFAYYSQNNNQKLYYIENNEYKEFGDLSKVALKVKESSKINSELLNKTNNEYESLFGKKMDGDMIYPFEIRTWNNEENRYNDVGIMDLASGTNSWWNMALENGLLASTSKTKTIVGNIVDVEHVYDSPKVYMDQRKLNKALGYQNYDSLLNNSNVNIWSNAKMSREDEPSDRYDRSIFKFMQANNTTTNASKYMSDAVGYTDYINLKKDAMSNLLKSVISIAIVFISISMVVGIIIIYVITDIFIGKYKSFMNYMRILGYTLREINSIVLWIFLPITFIFAALAIGLTAGIMFGVVPSLLLTIEIAIPFVIDWYVYLAIFGVAVAIFIIAYLIILRSLFKTNLAAFTGTTSQ